MAACPHRCNHPSLFVFESGFIIRFLCWMPWLKTPCSFRHPFLNYQRFRAALFKASDMAKSPEANYNHGLLLETCKNWWTPRKEKRLVRADLHLTREGNEPWVTHTTEYLRGWIRTRQLAEKAFQRYEPGKDQPTLHRWLVRREG